MNINKFLNEAKTEFRHINWPTKSEGVKLTLTVIGVSFGIALFLMLIDNLFIVILQRFILKY